jgi:hypothetical protein
VWLGWLERRSDLGPRVVIGHSEGDLVAILLAKRILPAGLVLLATPGRPLGDVLRHQIAAIGWPAATHEEALMPDMIHVLKLAPADRAEQMKVGADPAAPLALALIDAITAFVRRCALPDRP